MRSMWAAAILAFGSVWAVAAETPDFLQANLNPAVSPAVDFFEYANGGWLAKHPIPASESSWGVGSEVYELLYTTKRQLSEKAAASAAPAGSDARKIGDFWATAMDAELAERRGLQPLAAELKRIDAATSLEQVLDIAFALHPLEVEVPFNVSIEQDHKNSDMMAVYVNQAGLGLPDRDYYFNAEPGVATVRTEYVAHAARVLALLGRDATAAERDAAQVMAFETALAEVSRKLEDLRDPARNYHPMAPGDLQARLTPHIAWGARLAAWGLKPAQVVVGQPEYLAAMDGLLQRTPVPVLRDYLRLRLVDGYASFLNRAFDEERFRFRGRVLNGQKQQRERWKRVLDSEESAVGMVLGRLFVAETFPASAKQRYTAMVEAIRGAYRQRIQKLDWMSAATKAKALQKLAAMTSKVGYPDRWKDYSALQVGRESYAGNMMNAARWRWAEMLARYGKPVDRSEWHITPQTYNAYYSWSNNEIVLPAAIFLVPGVADALIDDAVAYGYAGASTIGHEITHGFDDEGRKFDAAGNLNDWWTDDDDQRFRRSAERMVRQFDAYEPLPGLHINGQASLGENIADHGGVLLGLDAFKQTEQYRRGEKIGGLTPLQRYFLGYALGWLGHERDESLRRQLLSDVHAPGKWRVLGPLSNVPEFYEAFGVKPGQPMWRPEGERVRIW